MGLLKHLLFWPVTGPMFLAEFSLDKVEDVVREELTDDTAVKAELYELQLKLELGDIDDEQYLLEEQRLVQRLREVREWRERFGMGVSGGLVRVADAEDGADGGDPAAPGAAGPDPSGASAPDDPAEPGRRPESDS